jgi:hypothetical protein
MADAVRLTEQNVTLFHEASVTPDARLAEQQVTLFHEASVTPDARLAEQQVTLFHEASIAPDARLTEQSVIVWYVPTDLEGAAAGTVTAGGTLDTSVDMTGAAAGETTATGTLSGDVDLAGHAESTVTALGNLSQDAAPFDLCAALEGTLHAAKDFLLVDNDNRLRLFGLRNRTTGEFVNDATVSAGLTTLAGDPVAGQSFPIALNYIPGSNGDYQAVLQNTLELIPRHWYRLRVTASGDGVDAVWVRKIKARVRT